MRAVVLEVSTVEGLTAAGPRLLLAVLRARVAALAVDDHRARQDQGIHATLVHGGEKHRGAEVVVPGVRREVGDRHAGPDHRRLVAHHVDAVEKPCPLPRVAHVDPVHVVGGRRVRSVRLRDQGVHPDDVVAASGELLVDLGTDEPAGAREQDPHEDGPGSSKGSVTSSSQSAHPQPDTSGRLRDHLGEQPLEPADVLLEQREDRGLVDRLLRAHPGVEVGDQGDRGVAEAELAGQDGLGVAGHVDQGPARLRIALRLGAGGEARPLDHHHRPAVEHPVAGSADERGPQVRAVGIRERRVGGARVDIGLHPGGGPVDELVGDHQGAGLGLRLQPAHGAGRQHLLDAEAAQCPHVGAVVDPVRRELVPGAVARQERDRLPGDLADRDRGGRVAVRRAHGDLGGVLEELVEATAADHGDAWVPRSGEISHEGSLPTSPQRRSVASRPPLERAGLLRSAATGRADARRWPARPGPSRRGRRPRPPRPR